MNSAAADIEARQQQEPAAPLCIAHLAAGYGGREIIADLSVQALAPGQITALLGPNGSGKSTLLKTLAGLVPMRRGAVTLGSRDLARMGIALRARHLAYVPQSLPAAVHLRVLESVLVAANAQPGPARTGGADAVRALLQRLDIEHLALHYLDELSGGQKQLVGLAQALIRKPRILLLDEPLSALDLNYQFHVMNLLRQETAAHRLITIIVLHDINIALRYAGQVLMIRNGALAAEGPPRQVIQPATLAEVYGVSARIELCSQGIPHALIDGLQRSVQE